MLLARNLKYFTILLSLTFASNLYGACATKGWFGEVCAKRDECVFSTIFWKAEYQCYMQYGKCEEANNICGWQQNPELVKCVQELRAAVASIDTFTD